MKPALHWSDPLLKDGAMRMARGFAVFLVLSSLPAVGRAGGSNDALRSYIAAYSGGVPSFARQTGLACSACHYQFLQLTPFGRKFKLNGYTLTNQRSITESDSTNGGRLDLNPLALVSELPRAPSQNIQNTAPRGNN